MIRMVINDCKFEKSLDEINSMIISLENKKFFYSFIIDLQLSYSEINSIKLFDEREKELKNSDYFEVIPSIFGMDVNNKKNINALLKIIKSDNKEFIQNYINKTTENLEMIAKTIIKAKRIFIFAYGDTGLTVEGFINKLTKLNYFPILATKNREDGYLIQNISKEDCVLFMTYSGNKDFNQYSYLIKKRGCPILSITSNENSAVYTKSDYRILIPSKELENKISTFYSQLAFHYLLNLIYSLIYQGISR